jgi:hypothetical protein
MFLHAGIVHFPEIPLLEVLDVWIGVGDDVNRLLYNIRRGIWGRDYVIVGINNYCYNLYGSLGTFTPRNLDWSTLENGVVKNNFFSWNSGTQHLYNDPIRGWVIDSTAYGDGNYYKVSWGNDNAVAVPYGPWTADEDPPTNEQLDIDWPRLQGRTGLVTVTEIGNYTPATTYVNGTVVGSIQVGVPYWRGFIDNETRVIVKTKSGYIDPHSRDVSYAFEDASEEMTEFGFVWNAKNDRYEYSGADGLYYASAPAVNSSWSITRVDGEGVSTSFTLSWGGWKRGRLEEDTWIYEIARIV